MGGGEVTLLLTTYYLLRGRSHLVRFAWVGVDESWHTSKAIKVRLCLQRVKVACDRWQVRGGIKWAWGWVG